MGCWAVLNKVERRCEWFVFLFCFVFFNFYARDWPNLNYLSVKRAAVHCERII